MKSNRKEEKQNNFYVDEETLEDLRKELESFGGIEGYRKMLEEEAKDPLNSQPITTLDTDENGNVILTSIAGADLIEGKYYLDDAETKKRVRGVLNMNPDEMLSEVIKMLPCGLIDKQVTGIGATYLELHCERNSIIVTPTRALAQNKLKENFLYVGTKEGQQIATTKAEIKAYLNNTEIQYKKILVVADSIDKVIDSIKENNEDVYSNYFLLVDEIDTLQSDNNYRPVLSRVIDHYFDFKIMRRALLSATVKQFTHPKLQKEHLTTIQSYTPCNRNINLFYTNNINKLLAEKIKEISNEHPAEKILIAYNSVLNILSTIKLLPEKLQYYETCAILCSEASKDTAGNYLTKLIENNTLPCRINFMTCSYFTGIDIEDSFHLITVSNSEKVYSALPVNKIIQIYGRCRKPHVILSDTVIYNNTKKPLKDLNTYRDILMKKAQKVIDLLKAAKTLKENDNDLKDLFNRIHKVIIERATERLFEQQSFELVRDNIKNELEISYFNIDALYEKMGAYYNLYSYKEGLCNCLMSLYPSTNFCDVSDSEEDSSGETLDTVKEESNQRYLNRLSNNIEELLSLSQEDVLDNEYLEMKIRNSKRREEEFYKRIKAHYQYYDITFLTKVLSDIALENKKSYRNLNNALIFRALEDNHPFKAQVFQDFKIGIKYSSKEIADILGTIVKDQLFKTLTLSKREASQSMLMNLFNSCVDSTYTGGKYLVKGNKPNFNKIEIPEPIRRIPKEEYATNYFEITQTTKSTQSTNSTNIIKIL